TAKNCSSVPETRSLWRRRKSPERSSRGEPRQVNSPHLALPPLNERGRRPNGLGHPDLSPPRRRVSHRPFWFLRSAPLPFPLIARAKSGHVARQSFASGRVGDDRQQASPPLRQRPSQPAQRRLA